MRYWVIVFLGLLLAASAFAGSTTLLPLSADTDPDIGPIAQYSPTDDQWDLLFNSEAGITCNDNQLLGVVFTGQHFYISGGNNGLDPNKVYLLNMDGTYYAEFDQWGPPGWGWRELTYDGVYLYACQDNMIYAMDLDGNPVSSMNIVLPFSPASALAYDPVLNHFWVVAGIMLYEITRTGTVIWFSPFSGGAPVGLAWDDAAPDGPWLWMFFQGGSPPTIIQQFDPISHWLTGFSYQLPLLPGSTNQVAGGLFFTGEWEPLQYVYVLGGLTQGTPEDQIFCLEMYPNIPDTFNVHIDLTLYPFYPPVNFDVQVTNHENFPVTFNAWIVVTLPTGYEILLVQREPTFGAGQSVTRYLTLNVPASAPAGIYSVTGYTGDYPDVIWDSDFFTFLKLGDGGGPTAAARFDSASFTLTGWAEPWETSLGAAVPSQFAVLGNYPNPFNPTTTISFALDQSNRVELTVFDVAGREVANLVKGFYLAGHYEVIFDASGLPAGVYIGYLTAAGKTASAKMILVK